MAMDSGKGVIQKKVLIQASPTVIFRALTESKELAHWFCDRAASDPKVGGEVRASWSVGKEGRSQRGRAMFTILEPDSRVEFCWVEEGGRKISEAERHSTSFAIRLKRGTSEVTVCDQGPPLEDEEAFDLLDRGWITVLRDLKEHCEARQRNARRQSVGKAQAG